MPAADAVTPVRVGVVSDTHLPRFGRLLPAALVRGLTEPPVDLILHLGDLTDLVAVELLEEIAPVRAVAGNNDGADVRARYPEMEIVHVGGCRLGMTHGHRGTGRTTEERARSLFRDEPVDAILFGHSHEPLCRRLPNGAGLLNPGSPTDRRRQSRFSWALLDIDGDGIRPRLRYYADRAASGSGSGSHSRRA